MLLLQQQQQHTQRPCSLCWRYSRLLQGAMAMLQLPPHLLALGLELYLHPLLVCRGSCGRLAWLLVPHLALGCGTAATLFAADCTP